ncbi:MAG: SMC-Scp complex subunit ScpB [Desulfobacterales bacterium]|nr:SMC-Scp complex subunit ScpB [Desulfobacterales bacterium]MBF0395322.1 SMC-Scp complex subunit ScpB [Desulfobacterales bacterium]
MNDKLPEIIESLLFVSNTPLTIEQIKKAVHEEEISSIKEAMCKLISYYEIRKGGFYLCEVSGGYQFRTNPEYKEWIKRFIQPSPLSLSKAAIETLAIIAYRQPIIRSELDHIRGVDCSGILRILLNRKLIKIMGRKEIPGRPLIYGTTKYFLEVFNLKDLKELPTPKEIQEICEQNP